MRLLLVLLGALVAGCGDDTTLPASTDLAQPVIDLAIPGLACGITSCPVDGSCAACVHVIGSGVCARPCKTASPDCTGGATCRSVAGSGDGGAAIDVTFSGSCTGYDGVCL